MKIKGEVLSQPNEEILVIPRSEGKDIVLRFRSVLEMDEFEKQFPPPQPPHKRLPGQKESTPDYTDPTYKKATEEYGGKKTKWMFLKSLEATEGLEWEKVKLNDPETWTLLDEELKDAGFNQFEVARIYQAMMKVNSLDEEYLAEARKRFFESAEGEVEN